MACLRRWCGGLLLVTGLSCGVALVLAGQQREVAPAAVAESIQPKLPVLPTHASLPRTPEGRHYPLVPQHPQAIASLLADLEAAIRNPSVASERIPALAHQQQVVYRVLSKDRNRSEAVRQALPSQWQWVFDQHIAARREFLAMHRRAPLRPRCRLGEFSHQLRRPSCLRPTAVPLRQRAFLGPSWLP